MSKLEFKNNNVRPKIGSINYYYSLDIEDLKSCFTAKSKNLENRDLKQLGLTCICIFKI